MNDKEDGRYRMKKVSTEKEQYVQSHVWNRGVSLEGTKSLRFIGKG